MRKVETSLFFKGCDSSLETVKKSLSESSLSPKRFERRGSSLPPRWRSGRVHRGPLRGSEVSPWIMFKSRLASGCCSKVSVPVSVPQLKCQTAGKAVRAIKSIRLKGNKRSISSKSFEGRRFGERRSRRMNADGRRHSGVG